MSRADLPFPKNQREFFQFFRDDEDCIEYMFQMRWTEGFECPHCGGDKYYRNTTKQYVFVCRNCRKDTSVIAGTVMERTHTPLVVWFFGAYLQATLKPGISALQFQCQSGLTRYETAFQILHKLRAAMVAPDRTKLSGTIEADETYVGGHEIGRPGRGAEKKSLVVGAVEVVQGADGPYSGRIRLELIPSATFENISNFLVKNVESGTVVRTDGFQGYNGIDVDGFIHKPFKLRDPEQAHVVFPHIHRVFGNLKAWLIGTHHGVTKKHIQAYLNEYVFRFNRRFDPMLSFNTMLGLATDAESPTYQELYRAGAPSGWEHPNPPDDEDDYDDEDDE